MQMHSAESLNAAMRVALSTAVSHHHDRIRTSHMLMGLLADLANPASMILERLGVNHDALQSQVESTLAAIKPEGPPIHIGDPEMMQPVPITPSAERLAQEAEHIMMRMHKENGRERILGTEHLLAAFFSHPESDACKLLAAHGVTLNAVRDQILGTA